MSEPIDLKKVLATLGEFGSTFDKMNDEPREVTKGVGDDTGAMPMLRKMLSPGDRILMQRELMKLSVDELQTLGGMQYKRGTGIPIEVAWDFQTRQAAAQDSELLKVLDSSTTALQRQDLEPILYSIN